MAHAQDIRIGRSAYSVWLRHSIEAIRDGLAKRRVYRQTLSELQSLSGRDLADIGLNRSMIRQVAHAAAYGD